MFGLFQTTFYFGYMALFSAALGLMCGKKERESERENELISYNFRNIWLCWCKQFCSYNLFNSKNRLKQQQQ